jgi:hypothetical protein
MQLGQRVFTDAASDQQDRVSTKCPGPIQLDFVDYEFFAEQRQVARLSSLSKVFVTAAEEREIAQDAYHGGASLLVASCPLWH